MTDQSLIRAYDVLSELVEMVETARTVPMSGSCVLPRERTLDLLDELREALPPELGRARELLHDRETMLSAARAQVEKLLTDAGRRAGDMTQSAAERAENTVAAAEAESERLRADSEAQAGRRLAEAGSRSEDMLSRASEQAHALIEDGKARNAYLVSAAGVHQAASAAAEKLRAEADEYGTNIRMRADDDAAHTRQDAEQYQHKLRADAEQYVEATLSDMIVTLQRVTATAERGREELRARRQPHGVGQDA